MNKILAFMTKHQNGLAMGIISVTYVAATAIALVWDKKRHEAEMETQRMIQEKIRNGEGTCQKPEES